MMAFIDDDSIMDDHSSRRDKLRPPHSPSMCLRPPHLQNGWASSPGSQAKQQQVLPRQQPEDIQMASSNMNNNNNNNNSGNANTGKRNIRFTQLLNS